MKVFCDLHHSDLYYSLYLLFEKRLGWKLYTQIGTEWFHEGFWKIAEPYGNSMGTVVQYLDKTNCGWMSFSKDGEDYIKDPVHTYDRRLITFEQFKETKFDIVISSFPAHIQAFSKLIELYQPQAKHIFQVGNSWGHLPGVKNILASTLPFKVASDINICFYHQEFNITDHFHYTDPVEHKTIYSFVHLMKEMHLLKQYKGLLNDYSFTTFGAGMDENICEYTLMGEKKREMSFMWHIKPEGDGYGHNLHHAYACGRPTLIKANYYQNKLGGYLLEDLKTCIDLSKRSVYDNVSLIRKYSQPEEHHKMCQNAFERFQQVVNFDEEEKKIRNFLQRLR